MATEQQPNGDPTYGPVRLPRLDAQGRLEIGDHIRDSTAFAAAVTGYGDGHPISQLSEAIAEQVVEETAPNGMALDKLCAGRIGEGHIREHFTEELRDLADIAVRAQLPMTNRTAIHEYIRSEPIKVGSESHALGVDHHPNAPHRGHLAVCSLGCCDRNLVNQADWFLTGTHDDRTSPRADIERIEQFESELGKRLPGSAGEHLDSFFAAEARAQAKVELAARAPHSAFTTYGIDSQRFLKFCFPKCVIVDRMPFGPPLPRSGKDSAEELFPGDDDQLVASIERADRYGVARCRLDEPEVKVKFAALDDMLIPRLSERFGERPEQISPSVLKQVAKWNVANLLGIGDNIMMVRIWKFEKSNLLLRAMQVSGEDGEVVDVDLWRTIRLGDSESLRAAFALVERAQQVWPRSCIRRYREECEPGLMKASSARTRAGLLNTSLIANAAGVGAHRAMEIRELREPR